jgi:hypothetical protein
MEAGMDEHEISGDVDEIALLNGQFERYRQQVRREPVKALAIAFGAGVVAMSAAMIFVIAIWRLAAVH